MKEDKMILYDSDEAAQYKTGISGWVNSKNIFYGDDEDLARWSGCTHKKCQCGIIMEKQYLMCKVCREKERVENYDNYPKEKWDYVSPIYCEGDYFYDEDELNDHCEEFECNPESLRLLICKPNYLPEIESDYFEDSLFDGRELPSNIAKALDDLNEVIRQYKDPISWYPTKIAAIV